MTQIAPALQKEMPDTGDFYLAAYPDLVSIYPHPQLPSPLADLPSLQFRYTFLRRPVGSHRAVGGPAYVVFIDS